MAARFHLTPEGPKPCSVDPANPSSRGCSYGEGGHYSTVAEAKSAFADQMGGAIPAPESMEESRREAEAFRAAIEHFSVANDLTAPEARALAHRLRTAPEHSGDREMYRGMTGYGGISGVSWDQLQPGARLPMEPRSWTDTEQVADEFSWDQTADEDDPSIKSVLIVAQQGIEGVPIQEHSRFGWQNEMVSTAGTFVVDSIESRDSGGSWEDAESISIIGHWETTELDDEQWEAALRPYSLDPS